MNVPLDTDNEEQLLLGRDVEVALLLGDTVEADLLALCVTVLLDVLLGTLEDDGALLLVELSMMLAWLHILQIQRVKVCILVDQTRKMVICNSIDLGLVAKWFYAS